MTRTHRFLGGVVVGSLQLVLATVVGLWMTPFLLHRVGQGVLGFWLVMQQLLGYVLLLDLGVNALLPREVAFATGRASATPDPTDLPRVIARARRVVWWQMPLVAAVAATLCVLTPGRWASHTAPLLLVFAGVVLLFPARLYQAVLQGLQDLPFLGKLQMLAWSATTVVTVALVVWGAGLWALVVGWLVGQLVTAAATWWRVAHHHGAAWPDRQLRPPWAEVKPYVVQAGWISIAQVAQVLLTGSDYMMIGTLLGAAAVVQYSCTTKLATVMANQPQLIMVSATPALSELFASGQRQRLLKLMVTLTLGMLTVSGLIACLVLALNAAFVGWWVGPAQYGGNYLTWLVAMQLLLRHWNITLIYGLICFGQERRVSITNLTDGVVSVAVGWALTSVLGVSGAVVGSITAVALTSLPANLIALARATGSRPATLCREVWPWASRAVLLGIGCSILPLVWAPSGFWGLASTAALVAAVYAIVMARALGGGPLGEMVKPRLIAFLGPGLTWKRAA